MAPYIEAIDSQHLFYFIVSREKYSTTYFKFFIRISLLLGMEVISDVSMFSYALQFRSFVLYIKIVRCSVLN